MPKKNKITKTLTLSGTLLASSLHMNLKKKKNVFSGVFKSHFFDKFVNFKGALWI